MWAALKMNLIPLNLMLLQNFSEADKEQLIEYLSRIYNTMLNYKGKEDKSNE